MKVVQIVFDERMREFTKSPNDYLLRLRGNRLYAEKKGISTWFRARFWDPQSYRLTNIVTELSQKWLACSERNVEELCEALCGKIQKYQDSIGRNPRQFSFRSLGWMARPTIPGTVVERMRQGMNERLIKDYIMLPESCLRRELEEIPLIQYGAITAEEVASEKGLKNISEAGVQICSVPGNGNCLFSSIATGVLARFSKEEVIERIDAEVANACLVLEREASKYQFRPEVRKVWDLIKGRLQNIKTETEAVSVLQNKEVRDQWSYLLRALSLAKQIDKWVKKEEVPLAVLLDEHQADSLEISSVIDYLHQMMVIDGPSVLYGSYSEITSLQACLKVRIPYIASSQCAERVFCSLYNPDVDENQHMTLEQIGPRDVLLLLNEAAIPHYDPAFVE